MDNSPQEKGANNNSINKKESSESLENPIVKDKNYYSQQVKMFMNINLKDQEYLDKIDKNPDSLFLFVDKYIIENWENDLRGSSPALENSPIPTEEQINSVKKDLEFQKIIKNDVNRTRVKESILIDNFKGHLEDLITYYCKSKNVFYKQGLNEIFGPLLLMKYKYKKLTLSTVYSLGEAFIENFLPNYYYIKELTPLKCSFGLLLILIRYHEPSVYNVLDSNEIIPEMYATNWVMTYILGKVKLDIFYNLWDYIIQINEPLFMHYFFVSIIINRRELIINCEKQFLATLMSSLTIVSNEELNTVIDKAKELINVTPYSFRILANRLGFLIPRNPNIQKNYEKYKPLSLPAMPVFPLETLFITNQSEIECPDENCKSWEKILGKNASSKNENNDKDYQCEKCDLDVKKNMKYFLLDIRILEYGLNEENDIDKTGYLPLMINVDQEELKSEDINDIITNRYINERGQYHFIFLTSNTDAFLNFEEKFYKLNISKEDEKKIMFGLMKRESEKKLNFDSEQLTKKQIFKLKEYDNLRKILKSLKQNNYPYIGFVYGGFEAIHKKSMEYNAELLLHNEETCILCQQKQQETGKGNVEKEERQEKNELYNKLWEQKKKIKFGELTSKYNSKYIFVGNLINYRNKDFRAENIQIILIINKKEYKIDMYKLLKSGIDLKSKMGYYGLGLNDEQKEKELTIFEELSVPCILGLSADSKIKNIINFVILDDQGKNKKNNINSYDIVVDLSSVASTKTFFSLFKELCQDYKATLKKK